jgi:hypothetical protein
VVRIAVLRWVGDLPVGAQDGQVGKPVDTDHLSVGAGPVGELRARLVPVTDDVSIGQQVPVGGQHHSRPGRVPAPAPHPQTRHPRDQQLRHSRDHPGVGIQHIVLSHHAAS